MTKIISRLAVVAGFLLAFSGCRLIQKSQAASEDSKSPSNRAVANTQSECNASNYRDFIDRHGVHKCNLRRTMLYEADFRGANCIGADFTGAILTRANFAGANCRDADFSGVVYYESAIFRETILIDAIMSYELREYARSQGALVDFTFYDRIRKGLRDFSDPFFEVFD